ncbi:ArgS-related anticodon-binding protein NrtL [Streptomyces sp. P17]|uniref:ArgS-related anticodon-binding protein NrtL n=1 Tax=Streptomyces sp. P17 TaxID=3074716 RepID=UPI0028F41B30|nr:DALR anticodon-binding domain-containing protein [Streptomyces sp. P17]MDT9699301.1 DALR anticodon-binding domain-containing protein [Streptomyces sp. P17]
MTPVELSRTVLRAVRRAVDEGELRVAVPERALVTVPGPGGCGDYATNIALQLARPAGRTPRHVAEILRPHLVGVDGVTDVVVTGPGFINFSLRATAPTALVEEILRRGPRYGFADGPTGQVVQLHCPHEVRAVVVMDVVRRLLRSQGALVRTSCEAPPEPEWQDVLGVRVDAAGRPDAPAPLDINVRPVPASADPVPLGRDAARWALLHPAAHDRPRITDEHLVQREANPLFRVRYAHARTRALTRNAADLGFTAAPGPTDADAHPHPHTATRNADDPALTAAPGPTDAAGAHAHPRTATGGAGDPALTAAPGPTDAAEAHARTHTATRNASDPGLTTAPGPTHLPKAHPLVAALADHPRILAVSAARHAPDRLARHLVTVADAALAFLPAVLPRGAEKPSAAHRARLALAEAAGAVLAGGLSLLGIDAPEHL